MNRALPLLSGRRFFCSQAPCFQTVFSLPRQTFRPFAMAANGANGSDSRPVFFFDIDNCVRCAEYSIASELSLILCVVL